jgi:hypothetical protein
LSILEFLRFAMWWGNLGEGTQAPLNCEYLKVPHLASIQVQSTPDFLRATQVSDTADSYQDVIGIQVVSSQSPQRLSFSVMNLILQGVINSAATLCRVRVKADFSRISCFPTETDRIHDHWDHQLLRDPMSLAFKV